MNTVVSKFKMDKIMKFVLVVQKFSFIVMDAWISIQQGDLEILIIFIVILVLMIDNSNKIHRDKILKLFKILSKIQVNKILLELIEEFNHKFKRFLGKQI